MFDDPCAYYHENVVTAFLEYRDATGDGLAGRSRDLRLALTAASALFHLAEHLDPRPSRATLEQLCPDYGLLGDIVNAAKHMSVTNKTPHGEPLIKEATQLDELIEITLYEDERGEYRFAEKTVVVRLNDGTERNLLDVLTNVINFWEQYLHEVGLLATPRTFVHSNCVAARTRAECEENRLNFEMVQGQRFRQALRLQRYNSETGTVSPIDLTGSEIHFSLYRPRQTFDLSLVHAASGQTFTKAVPLSEAEAEMVAQLPDGAARQAYVQSLPCVQETMHQLATEAELITSAP